MELRKRNGITKKKWNYENLDPGMRLGKDNAKVVRQCLYFFVYHFSCFNKF